LDKAPDAFRTISEVAEDLAVPQHVLRFWETRFAQIKPMKRGGGRRYYRPDDVDLLRGIRHLLYGEGYTIRGVQRILREHGAKFVQTVWHEDAPQPERHPADDEAADDAAVAATADDEDGGERARGLLLGLLPSLFGPAEDKEPPQDEDEGEGEGEGARREPRFGPEPRPARTETASDARPMASAAPLRRAPGAAGPARTIAEAGPAAAAPPAPPAAGIPPHDLQRLHAALQELGECRRLIDVALKDA
jgi:DNA-binding transcriptional MerR regulator